MVKALICGGRNFKDRGLLFGTLDHAYPPITHVVEGGADGADAMAREWARDRCVPFTEYTADWRREGKKAGPLRNLRMLNDSKPDVVIAFPGGKGTHDMVAKAMAAKVSVHIV